MPSMRDQFQHLYAPGEDATAAAMGTGLIAPDTNVLLNFYRYQAAARDQLFGALEKVGDRLWIPHQVGLEFHRRRLDVMADQEGYFDKTADEIRAAVKTLDGKVRAFGSRIGLPPAEVRKITDGITELNRLITAEVTRAREFNEVRVGDHAADAILARIHDLFDDRVGDPLPHEELRKARAEAERRITDHIPPGYKDKNKDDPSGDYLIWHQLITEAKKRQLPVIVITDDIKEDWYQRQQGQTLGARCELREEMMTSAGVPLLLMTTDTFLRHAGKYLNAEVSQETVEQARDVATAPKRPESAQTSVRELTRQLVRYQRMVFDGHLARNLERLPPQDHTDVERAVQFVRPVDGYLKLCLPELASPAEENEYEAVLESLSEEQMDAITSALHETRVAVRMILDRAKLIQP